MSTEKTSTASRRDFLKTSSAVTAAAVAAPFIMTSKTHAVSPGDTIKVGLVGCGGRGTGAAGNALSADPNVVITAVADIYENKAQSAVETLSSMKDAGKRVEVPKKNIFAGFDAFSGVIESGVDVVLLATPPGFRPQHMKAAVAAGKHMFIEKPMATDAPGVRSIMESTERAKEKGLGICAGFCWRYNHAERALHEQVHNGAIGDIRAMYATYNTGQLWDRTNPKDTTALQKQLRNWYYYTWLSGDFIAEQAVHAIDWMQWAMKDATPLRAIAHGGRQVRVQEQYGHINDHFEVVYEYAGGVRGFLFCRQQNNCASDNSATYYGSKGTARETGFKNEHQINDLSGERIWKYEGKRPDMYVVEHEMFYSSLRAGKPINDGDRMAKSTMCAIMGRTAAYTGQIITWDMMMKSQEQLVPENLTWDSPAPEVKVAMPGQTKFI